MLFSFKRPRKILLNSRPKEEFKWPWKGLAQFGNSSRSHPGAWPGERDSTDWKIYHRLGSGGEMRTPSPAPTVSNINRNPFFDRGRSRTCCPLPRGAGGSPGVRPHPFPIAGCAGTATGGKAPEYSWLNWWDGAAGSKCISLSRSPRHFEMSRSSLRSCRAPEREKEGIGISRASNYAGMGSRSPRCVEQAGVGSQPFWNKLSCSRFPLSAVIFVPLLHVNWSFLFPFLAETSAFNARKQ